MQVSSDPAFMHMQVGTLETTWKNGKAFSGKVSPEKWEPWCSM